MDRISRERALFLGVAALRDVANQARRDPIPPNIQLRALLALVALQSNGDLKSYTDFWRTCIAQPRPNQHPGPAAYERGLYGNVAMIGIQRSLGISSDDPVFHKAVHRILSPPGEAIGNPPATSKRDCGFF